MSAPRPHAPELLAPAGGPSALAAALANGAEAVYLGVDRLNARRGAENFTLESLGDACRSAHLQGVRVYLTVNVVVLAAEMAGAIDLVDRAWVAGVDAIIVQDLGLLRAVRTYLPHVRVHSSTQINTHNTPTIDVLGGLGVSRVTLAREVSLEEIASFASLDRIEIESFVHGALCVCYSGQCLMSSLIGGRSANRGQCAQPCRLTYELVDAEGTALTTPGAHLLSPKDLAGITVLPRLVEAGVSALKIEGRMKNPEYVALVTGVYREALDRAVADPADFVVRDGEMAVLAESFSRGFTEAYLLGERGNEMMSYQRPNNRGVKVGRIAGIVDNRATITLESQLDSEDTIEVWTSSGRFAQPVGPLEFDGGMHAMAPAGKGAVITLEGAANVGDRVFRVRNAALTSAARRTFEGGRPSAQLDFSAKVVVGEPLKLTVSDARGRSGVAEGGIVEPARTKAVTAEEIVEHVGRLGGTRYEIGEFDLELQPGAGIGFSALHAVRRDAIAAYEAALLAQWSGREISGPRVSVPSRRSAGTPSLDVVAEASSLDVAEACLAAGAHRVHVPTAALPIDGYPVGVVPLIERVLHDRDVTRALKCAAGAPVVAVGNLGMLPQFAGGDALVEAHWSLNALNPWSVEQLAELGAGFVWLSPELASEQVFDLCRGAAVPVGVAVWGRQEVMVTEHCVLMAEGECDRRCAGCARRAAPRLLRDRKAYEFPVRTDVTGRTHVYNSVPLDITPALVDLLGAGVGAVRVDVHTETPDAAAAAVRRVLRAGEQALRGIAVERPAGAAATSGHFYRGVS